MAAKPFTDPHLVAAADLNDMVGVYARETSALTTVVNSIAETTVYTKEISAAHMSIDRVLRGTVVADCLQNSGGAGILHVRAKYGGTTFAEAILSAIPAGASRFDATFRFELCMRGATNAQVGVGNMQPHADGSYGIAQVLSLAVDATVDQDLVVTAQMDVAHASFEYRPLYVLLELC